MATPHLNRFERARIIGARSLQLASGAPPLVEVSEGMTSILIATRELDDNIVPLVVVR